MSGTTSFWDRRRAAVQAEAEGDQKAQLAEKNAEEIAQLEEKSDEDILNELGLPDPETLKLGDDFSGFMAGNVPERLRKIALRKLWRSNPVLACIDGLNDYDDDFHAAMLNPEPIKTAYQVGKGMLKHLQEMERQEQEKQAEAAQEEIATNANVAVDSDSDSDAEALSSQPVAREEPVSTEEPVLEIDTPTHEERTPVPRRMRFRFEEANV